MQGLAIAVKDAAVVNWGCDDVTASLKLLTGIFLSLEVGTGLPHRGEVGLYAPSVEAFEVMPTMTVFTQHCMADDAAAKSFTDNALHHLALLTNSDLGLAVKCQALGAGIVWIDPWRYRSASLAWLGHGVLVVTVVDIHAEVLHWVCCDVLTVPPGFVWD